MTDRIDLVIFDCDGVLVDSERIATRVNVAVGVELGWPITEAEVIDQFIGRSAASIGELIAACLGRDLAETWARRFELLHRAVTEAGLTPVDGVVNALDQITVPTCVASSGTHEKMRHTLGPHRSVPAVRRAHLQLDRGRSGQARARSVPARRCDDGGGAGGMCRGRGQPRSACRRPAPPACGVSVTRAV